MSGAAAKRAHIRLVSLDCDGVMTDGTLFYGEDGRQWRAFHVHDGVGIRMLIEAGLEVAFVTASRTDAIRRRAEVLGVKHCLVGVGDKKEALVELCSRLGIGFDAVAHMGDDLNDLPVLEAVGLAATVPNAVPAVHAAAGYTTGRAGGAGAVREFAEWLLDGRDSAGEGE
ncbi:MAG: HAD-IIIA family hydrolase [Defluviicoccus sp.]|nr:HAD-IIIA family hydrolase [Defluviicoccus sp.]